MLNYFLSLGMRFSGYFFQLAALVIITELLGKNNIGLYFFYVALNSIVASLIDFGYIRYSFRYYNKYVAEELVISKTLDVIVLNFFVCFVVLGGGMFAIGYAYAPLLIVGSVFLQMINVGKNISIAANRMLAATFIETIYGLVYLIIVLALVVVFVDVTIEVILIATVVAQIFSFCMSVVVSNTYKFYFRIISGFSLINLKYTYFHRIKTAYKKTIMVGADVAVSSIWQQSLIIFSGIAGVQSSIAQLGFFLRIFNIVKGFVSVGINYRMKEFYGESNKNFYWRVFGVGFIVTAFSYCFIFVFFGAEKYLPFEGQSETLDVLTGLSNNWLLVSMVFGLFFVSQNISFLLLGMNKRGVRLAASTIGFLVFCAFFLFGYFTDGFESGKWLFFYMTSMLAYLIVMLGGFYLNKREG